MSTISVIVPVYNVEPYIHRCIDSILNQTFKDFDLILVDDGSPDNCGKICDEYALKDNRIVVIHKENGGLSDARNNGIEWALKNSKSEWLTFIDSDDWVHPNYLKYLYNPFSIYKNIQLSLCCHCSTNKFSDFSDLPSSFNICTYEELYCNHRTDSVIACGKLFKKLDFETIRFPLGKRNEDLFTIHRIIGNYTDIAYIKSDLYFYYQSENSIMRSAWSIKNLDEIKAQKQLAYYFKENNQKIYKTAYRDYIEIFRRNLVELHQHYSFYNLIFIKQVIQFRFSLYISKMQNIKIKNKDLCYSLAYPVAFKFIKFCKKKVNHFFEK